MTPFLPLVLSFLLALVVAFLDGKRRWVGVMAAVGLLGILVLDGVILVDTVRFGPVQAVTGSWNAGIGIRFEADPLAAIFAVACTLVILASLVHEVARGVEAAKFPCLLLFLSTGLHGLFFTGDAFNFYVFFELSMIASFALVTYGHERAELRATFTFVVVNLLGSVTFLIAIGALYHVSGTLDLAQLSRWARRQPPNTLNLFGALFLAAFSLKLGLFPFHFWLPAVYRDARPAVAAVLAGALADIGSYGILRFGAGALSGELQAASGVLLLIGAASALYGSLVALFRRSSVEVVAYAAVAHSGYILLALGLAPATGIGAAVLLALAGTLDKAALMLALQGKGAWAKAAFAVAGCSAAGIPLTLGFMGKAALVIGAVKDAASGVVGVVVLAGALAMVFLFRAWFFDPDTTAGPPGSARAAAALGAVIIAVAVWPQPLLEVAGGIASSLAGGR